MQIRDSNRPMLLAAAKQHNCEVIDLGITCDSEAAVTKMLDLALASNADILITSGGVSMGDKDFVKPILEQRGKVYFSKVEILLLMQGFHLINDFGVDNISSLTLYVHWVLNSGFSSLTALLHPIFYSCQVIKCFSVHAQGIDKHRIYSFSLHFLQQRISTLESCRRDSTFLCRF